MGTGHCCLTEIFSDHFITTLAFDIIVNFVIPFKSDPFEPWLEYTNLLMSPTLLHYGEHL
jgi:hypothetical protein